MDEVAPCALSQRSPKCVGPDFTCIQSCEFGTSSRRAGRPLNLGSPKTSLQAAVQRQHWWVQPGGAAVGLGAQTGRAHPGALTRPPQMWLQERHLAALDVVGAVDRHPCCLHVTGVRVRTVAWDAAELRYTPEALRAAQAADDEGSNRPLRRRSCGTGRTLDSRCPPPPLGT